MFPRWWRLGIRPQLTIIVILGAILSTAATLFIADTAIQNYVLDQARTQEKENMKIANLVLQTQYGQNVSISSDNQMVVDTPGSGANVNLDAPNFGRYPLNENVDYVDQVQQLIGGSVSVFQCANSRGDFTPCNRIATTFTKPGSQGGLLQRETGVGLTTAITRNMNLDGTPHEWLGVDTIDGRDYYADYTPLYNPQHQLIGVLFVGVPLDTVTAVVNQTTIELVLIGTVIMIAGIIFALFFANTIITTLQRAARQISGASERIGGIAAQQANGSAQQVWAINAINQALQNFSETARDISQRTDQLALMGNQVLQRRAEISPPQIDSILAYITRSVRDISVASRQQASQYDRMTGAMQAVIEIAEQVAGNSQQSSESSERLELVVRQLRQLVGVRVARRNMTETGTSGMGMTTDAGLNGNATSSQSTMKGTVRAVRPASKGKSAAALAGPEMGQIPSGQQGAETGRMGMFSEQPQQMAGALPGSSTNGMGGMGARAGGGAMGAMPVAGGRGGMTTGQGQFNSGRPMGPGPMGPPNNALRGAINANGGMSGPGMGPMGANGNSGPFGGQENDWRLPPMPEFPPIPGWGDGQGQFGPPPNGRGQPGPNSGPNNFGGPSGPNGSGWPRGR